MCGRELRDKLYELDLIGGTITLSRGTSMAFIVPKANERKLIEATHFGSLYSALKNDSFYLSNRRNFNKWHADYGFEYKFGKQSAMEELLSSRIH